MFPALTGLATTLALHGSGADVATRLGLPADANEGLVFASAIGVAYTLIAVLERLLPHRSEWNRPQGDVRTDLAHLFITGVGTHQLVKGSLYGVAMGGAAWLSARLGFGLWPAHWHPLSQLVLALLIAELGHYWFHRWSHERALIWRLHAAHHSAPRLYWLNATRFHPFDLFFLIVFQTLPLILLGAPSRTFTLYTLFTAIYGQIQHCNIAVRSGPLNWIFSTPDLHRWHHSTDSREGNANYGAVLILWDVVFGTFFLPRGRAFTGAVGIEALPRFPRGYLGQLLSPFRWERIRADNMGWHVERPRSAAGQ